MVQSVSSALRLPRAARASSTLKSRLRGRCGEERGEIEHVVPAQVLDEGLHGRLAAPAFLEVADLKVEIARGLAGEDREFCVGGVPVRAVARKADLRLLRARLEVLSTRGEGEEHDRKQ